MMIDIVELAKITGALLTIGGVLLAVFKFVESTKKNNEHQNEEIRKIKREQTLTVYALRACLNGLHQQGCNGEVTKALEKLDKHINQAAHDDFE